MNLLNDKVVNIVVKDIVSNSPKIKVKSGKCRYNFRCQLNAVHDALNNKQDKIAMCFYVQNNHPNIHFLNVDNKGNYIDNTVGRWSETYDYYLIKIIEKENFFRIDKIFSEYRKELKSKIPFYIRWFSDCEF